MVLGKMKFLKGRNKLIEKVTFEQRFEGSERVSQEYRERKTDPN